MRNPIVREKASLPVLVAVAMVAVVTLARGAVYELVVPLPALRDSTVHIQVPIDLGGPARLTQPIRYHADVVAQWGTFTCNACGGDDEFYLPPPCEWNTNVGAYFSTSVTSGDDPVYAVWYQNLAGAGPLDVDTGFFPRLVNLLPDGTGTIDIRYFWFWFEAINNCIAARGSGWPVGIGTLEFVSGLRIRIEYETIVSNEATSWGCLKATYR